MDLRPYNKVYGQELGLDVSLCFGFRCSAAAETREDKGRRRRRGGRRGKREFIHCAPAAVISASQAGGGAARADADWNARNVILSLSIPEREREGERERADQVHMEVHGRWGTEKVRQFREMTAYLRQTPRALRTASSARKRTILYDGAAATQPIQHVAAYTYPGRQEV